MLAQKGTIEVHDKDGIGTVHDLEFSNNSFPHFSFGFNVDDLAGVFISTCFACPFPRMRLLAYLSGHDHVCRQMPDFANSSSISVSEVLEHFQVLSLQVQFVLDPDLQIRFFGLCGAWRRRGWGSQRKSFFILAFQRGLLRYTGISHLVDGRFARRKWQRRKQCARRRMRVVGFDVLALALAQARGESGMSGSLENEVSQAWSDCAPVATMLRADWRL